jgi:hypothetical protein
MKRISFIKNKQGLFFDEPQGRGRRMKYIRYVPDRSQIDVVEGCKYNVLEVKEVASKLPHLLKVVFVTLPTWEVDENAFREQKAKELAKAQELKEIEKISQEWVERLDPYRDGFEKIPSRIRSFFALEEVCYTVGRFKVGLYEVRALNNAIDQANSWIAKYDYILAQSCNWEEIINWLDQRTNLIKTSTEEVDVVLDKLGEQIKALKTTLESLPKRVDVMVDNTPYTLVESPLGCRSGFGYSKMVYGEMSHYIPESDDGYRPGGYFKTTGYSEVFIDLADYPKHLQMAQEKFAENKELKRRISELDDEHTREYAKKVGIKRRVMKEMVALIAPEFREYAEIYNRYYL